MACGGQRGAGRPETPQTETKNVMEQLYQLWTYGASQSVSVFNSNGFLKSCFYPYAFTLYKLKPFLEGVQDDALAQAFAEALH